MNHNPDQTIDVLNDKVKNMAFIVVLTFTSKVYSLLILSKLAASTSIHIDGFLKLFLKIKNFIYKQIIKQRNFIDNQLIYQ